MKKLMALIAMVAMVAVSSVAYGQATSQNAIVDVTLSDTTAFTLCGGSFTIPAMTVMDFQEGTCTITAGTNAVNGFEIDVYGENTGLYDGSANTWTALATDKNLIIKGTENWGYNLANAGAYTVTTDSDNGTDSFDTASSYHTMPTSALPDTVIDDAGPVSASSTFDLNVAAASDADTVPATYDDQLTVTMTLT